ncbi:MAG: DUF2125 domain-containing protein [Pseudomonadota bacterium]
MKLKILAGVLAVAPFLWFAWWFIAASAQEEAVERWLQDRREQGWQAEVAEIDVRGFPNRLDTKLTEPTIADTITGWSWEASRLDLRQVAYDPTFLVVEWPPEQRFSVPGARATLRSAEMEASLKVSSTTAFDLLRASFDLQNAAISADAGWTAAADRLTTHIRLAPDAGPDNAYEFRMDALRIRPPEFLSRIADPTGTLPAHLEFAAAEGRIALDRPLNRYSLEGFSLSASAISLRSASAEWGGLRLSTTGSAVVDAEGYAEGEFDVTAANWREMLSTAVAAGAIGRGLADTLEAGLGFVARLGGDPNVLDVALTFRGGLARIGPVPVGTAPRMRPEI